MSVYVVPFEVEPISYEDSLRALHSSLKFGICPLLETVESMLAELGNPDLSYACVQVAGTNGKTSTARYTAAILSGEGLSVALYTSPELVDYTERMEIGGKPVSGSQFARGIAAAVEAGRRVNNRREHRGEEPYQITEFDLLTVAASVVFAEADVDAVVLEVGMGGRWDATSAFKSIRTVAITGIGLDHTRILGDTLEEIAAEKASVIKRGRTCVLGTGVATPASVEDVFLNRCDAEGVVPVLVRPQNLEDAKGVMQSGEVRSHDDLPKSEYVVSERPHHLGDALTMDVITPLTTYERVRAIKPIYQAGNICCAMVLAEQFLKRPLSKHRLIESVMSCPTPGRFDLVRADPPVLVDACHNPQSVEAFIVAMRAMEPDVRKRPTLLCAVLSDKDVDGIVGQLAYEFPRVACARTDSPRALSAEALKERFEAHGAQHVTCYRSVELAVEALDGEAFVACGSITTAGAVTAIMREGSAK